MRIGEGGASTSAAAAAAERARERAAEARRKAEQARRAAERAQQEAAEAQKQAQAAHTAQSEAQARVRDTQQALVQRKTELGNTPGPRGQALQKTVDGLSRDLEGAQGDLKVANDGARAADAKLQTAQEHQALTAKAAEDAMTSSDAAAQKAPGLTATSEPTYGKQEIAREGLQANVVKDAFDGASGRRRADLAEKLGVSPSSDPKEIQADLDADRDYARLAQNPDTATTLRKLNIDDGQGLRGFGRRLQRQAQGMPPRTGDVDLGALKGQKGFAQVIQSATSTLDDNVVGGAVNRIAHGGNVLDTLGHSFDQLSLEGRVKSPLFAQQVALGQSPHQAANLHGTDLAVAVYNHDLKGAVDKPVNQWTEVDANRYTAKLADEVEQYKGDPEAVNSLLTMSGPQLQKSAEIIGARTNDNGNEDAVKGLTANLSRIGNAAPPKSAARLAYAIATKIPEDSEQHYVDDGFGEYIDKQGGSSQFRDLIGAALSSQGKRDAAQEMVEKNGGSLLSHPGQVISNEFHDAVGDVGHFFAGLANDVKKGATDLYNFVSKEVVGKLGDSIRNAATSVLNIDDQVAALKSPGDSFDATAGVDGSLFGVQVGADVEAKITKTEDGYSLELTGEGSLGVASKLGLPGVSAAAEAKGSASASVEFDFKNAKQVTDAANTVAGVALGVGVTAAGGPLAPVGLAMVASAGDELGNLADHYQGTTLQLKQEANVTADLGEKLGLPGASASGSAATAEAIEIPKDGPPQLILTQSVGVKGDLDVADGLPLPGGGEVAPGRLSGSADIDLETKVPIDVDVGQLVKDPVGALSQAGRTAIDQATTKLTGTVDLAAGAQVTGGPVTLGHDQGLEVSISAEAKTKDLASALGKAFQGDLHGALNDLGQKVNVEGQVRTYQESSGGIDHEGAGIGIASVDVTAKVDRRSSEIVTDYKGTPSQLLHRFGGVIDGVSFRKAA